MQLKVLFPVIILALGITGVGLYAAGANQPVTKPQDGMTDPTKALVVKSDSTTFTIKLRSNPTTGYSWVLRANYNAEIITPVAHAFHAAKTTMVGAPGYETFEFKISEKGFLVPQTLQLTFEYVRPWQVSSNPEKTLFTIVTR